MVHSFFKYLAIVFIGTVLFTACQNSSDDNPTIPGGTQTPDAGNWKVSYFFDKKDETSNYTNYVFDFQSNGTLTVTGGSQTYTGVWSTGYDDSADKFLITFNGIVPSALEELAEDWRIVEMTDQLIHLEHTSGGNGDTDVLKFVK